MYCSTIIPTIGRPSLSTAVNSVLNQTHGQGEFEIIVVNDSGGPLRDAPWQHAGVVTIVDTNRRNRSVARNTGAAIARGRYLHFLDDDDWMLPDAFRHLWGLAAASDASWLYGAFTLVDNLGQRLTEVRPEESHNCAIQLLAWEWLPLQASLISAKAFFAVGGFESLDALLGGFEDIHLSRQISLHGDIARTDALVATIRVGEAGSTTDYVGMFRQNRQSREKNLESAAAFRRLKLSADSRGARVAYWRGKLVYYYLASLKWNLRRGRVSVAASRLCHAALGACVSQHVLSPQFWRGVAAPHYPRIAAALREAGADRLYLETRRKVAMDD